MGRQCPEISRPLPARPGRPADAGAGALTPESAWFPGPSPPPSAPSETGQSGGRLTLVPNERSMTVLPADTDWHEHLPLRRAAPGTHLCGARDAGPRARRLGSAGRGMALSQLRAPARVSQFPGGRDDALRESGVRPSLLGATRRRAVRTRSVQQLQSLARLQRRQPRARSPRPLATAPRSRLHDAGGGRLHPGESLRRLQQDQLLSVRGAELSREDQSLPSRLHPHALPLALEASRGRLRRVSVVPELPIGGGWQERGRQIRSGQNGCRGGSRDEVRERRPMPVNGRRVPRRAWPRR